MRTLTALATAATIAVPAVAAPASAEARPGWWAPAVIGGLAVGAIVGSALARPYGYYAPSYAAPSYAPSYDYYNAPQGPTYYRYYSAPRPNFHGRHGCWNHRWC
jgi:hypothetical protein